MRDENEIAKLEMRFNLADARCDGLWEALRAVRDRVEAKVLVHLALNKHLDARDEIRCKLHAARRVAK